MTTPGGGSPRRLRLAASGGVLLALVGVWLGHTVEYARVSGLGGAGAVMVRSLHVYMLPVGLLLALAAAAGAVRGVRLWLALGRQLAALRLALPGALRGRGAVSAGDAGAFGAQRRASGQTGRAGGHGGLLRLAGWWLPLTALQIGLYLFQENAEAAIAGAPAPGLGAISGVHALAPLVHAAVALVLCAAVALALRLLHRRADAVSRVAALLRHLLDRLGSLRPLTPGATVPALVPFDRFGRLWCRPPPVPVSAWHPLLARRASPVRVATRQFRTLGARTQWDLSRWAAVARPCCGAPPPRSAAHLWRRSPSCRCRRTPSSRSARTRWPSAGPRSRRTSDSTTRRR